MGDFAERISSAAAVLQAIVSDARGRHDERDVQAARTYAPSPAMLRLQEQAWIEARWPIAWPSWPPGWRSRAIALTQKLLRGMLSWYIEPIVRQQNEFNQATLLVLDELASEIAALKAGRPPTPGEQTVQYDLAQSRIETLQARYKKD